MNKTVLLISTLVAATACTGIAQSAEKLGEHPAVIVARTWNARGIDPNTFIVAHPARGQLIAASPNANKDKVVQATASTSAAAGK
jgi:hypothetical protein